jgi:hypothetical protein
MEQELWRQWQAFATAMTSGLAAGAAPGTHPPTDRFTSAARRFMEDTANSSAAGFSAAATTFGDSLREQFADLFQMPAATGVGTATFGGAAPALGLMREHQRRWQRAADARQRTEEAQRRLQRLWSDALRDAAADFAARLKAGASADALYDGWIECAEAAYARMAHSEPFCAALADFLDAGAEWRSSLQADVENWAKQLDLPTRGEINSLIQRLQAVERKLRQPAPKPASKPARKPKRKAAAKTKRPS